MTDSQNPTLFVFPGQGTQYVGMARDLLNDFAEARAVYAEAADILGYDLAALSTAGPAEQLDQTLFTQPAIFVHGHACLTVLRAIAGAAATPGAAAGHSIGEYNALVAADALGFADALRLVEARASAMQAHGRGGMIALRADRDAARRLARRFYCAVAVLNSDRQTVVGGEAADLDRLSAHCTDVERTVHTRLVTSGAFHTHLMIGAAEAFRAALDAAPFRPPVVPVLANSTGDFHAQDADSLRSSLFFQVFEPVDWMGCMTRALEAGYTRVVELGGGGGEGDDPATKRPRLESVTRSLMKSAGVKGARLHGINVASLRATAEALAG